MDASPESSRSSGLSVVIVNYNGRRYLNACLESLMRQGKDLHLEVVLVDNGSTDGSIPLVRNTFPSVGLLPLKENAGFSRANNRGLKECREDFILFLNPDTRLLDGALEKLFVFLRGNPAVGAVGPALRTEEGRFQVSFGRRVHFLGEFIQKFFLNVFLSFRLKSRKKRRKVGWLSGACLLTRRSVLDRVGGFDPAFFLYFEDIDLCYRMREAGYSLVYLPEAEVIHHGGGITSRRKTDSRFQYRKSQVYFYDKHNSPLSLCLLKLFLRVDFILKVGYYRLTDRRAAGKYRTFFDLLKREPETAGRKRGGHG